MKRSERREMDQRRRKRLMQKTRSEVNALLRNPDGLARLRAISDEEWQKAVNGLWNSRTMAISSTISLFDFLKRLNYPATRVPKKFQTTKNLLLTLRITFLHFNSMLLSKQKDDARRWAV